MEFIAKKYTILMNNEPIEIWIRNNQIKQSKFMEQKVKLDLDLKTIKQIQSFPTRVVNGANLQENKNFTQATSKMMSQHLDMAILKNDKKTLSRFARSDLVPESSKENFIEAINHPNGLRGLLVKAVNKTNAIFQTLAKKIDRYFDKVKDKIANQKLDKYLEEYQLKEFNKAPPLKDLDLKQNVSAKLKDMAEEFLKEKNIKDLDDEKISSKLYQNEFMQKAAISGLSAIEAKIALAQEIHKNQSKEQIETKLSEIQNIKKNIKVRDTTIADLKKQLEVYQIKEASKNETLEDFKLITKDINAVDKIDVLLKNTEYQKASNEEKLKIEDKYLYSQEPLQERASELKVIANELPKTQEVIYKTIYKRDTTFDFNSEPIKQELNQKWSELQKINREQQAQNRDFMNISAVKFNGVSTSQLSKWQDIAIKNGGNAEVVQKYVDASLRNAEQLKQAGVFKEVEKGEFKFTDQFAKETLYKNIDKTNKQIAEANKGNESNINFNPKEELTQRVKDLSSEQSFAKLIGQDGSIDSQQLHKFAEHLQKLSTQLKVEEKANIVTKDDLKLAQNGQKQSQSHEQQRA